MRKIVLLWMGVLVCSSVALGAFDVTISGGYRASLKVEGQESLLIRGGHTELKPLMPAMLRYGAHHLCLFRKIPEELWGSISTIQVGCS